ncbi:hypothetical protein UFOVP1246_1 [uncultured Caudovirales phage]|jgi:hypothetical protein|uniref:Uncharacterized protein n=1 Tax=uncultured Caudovirales phage TaxID=2100421 RepID=A0A6J5R7S6_9CAUD|nr:hypothetical protein UFOVP1246_1 [uncultured Caudovirales phage]
MTISSSKDVLNEGLRSHLDQLANSVSYYYGKLQALELPRDLAEDLVIDWHKGKVQEWVDRQKSVTTPPARGGTKIG